MTDTQGDDTIMHCALCNIIIGTHSRNFCLEPERCGCYCTEDDGSFPQQFRDNMPPYLLQSRAVQLVRQLLAERDAARADSERYRAALLCEPCGKVWDAKDVGRIAGRCAACGEPSALAAHDALRAAAETDAIVVR